VVPAGNEQLVLAGTSATSASEIHRPSSSSKIACGYSMPPKSCSGMRLIVAATAGSILAVAIASPISRGGP
jgi:hypothetical protein